MANKCATWKGKRISSGSALGGVDVLAGDIVVTIKGFDPAYKFRKGPPVPVLFVEGPDGETILKVQKANEDLCCREFDDPKVENWIGKKLCLTFDPSVTFGDKKVGGIRVKVGGTKQQQQKRKEPDAGKSDALMTELTNLIADAKSLDDLDAAGVSIKTQSDDLTSSDIATLQGAYRTKRSELEAAESSGEL